jgi:uncharacterized protein YjbJ (UPF0337 family)
MFGAQASQGAEPVSKSVFCLNFLRRYVMNWDRIEGNWKQLKGKVKEKWGKLTNDDLTTVAGKRDQLAGLLQQRYGYQKDQAEKELEEFSRSLPA